MRGMGWSLLAVAKSVGSLYCECGAGVTVKEGLRWTRLSSP